jgi:hypothetical protein
VYCWKSICELRGSSAINKTVLIPVNALYIKRLQTVHGRIQILVKGSLARLIFWRLLRLQTVLGRRMASSGMLRRVALVRTDVSEEPSTSIKRVTRIGELGTLAVTSNRRTHLVFLRSVRRLLVTANVPNSPILVTLLMEALRSSETSVLTTATQRTISEDAIIYSHRRENLKS